MAHVFISYAHTDSDFVALMKLELEKSGFTTWVDHDRLQAGEDWRVGIDEAIQGAFAVIAVMTQEAYQSQYVTYEWAYALGMGVKVIPLMLRETALHPRLEALQYLNFSGRNERPWERLMQRLSEIEQQFNPGKVSVSRDAPSAVKQAVLMLDSYNPEERKAALNSLAQMSHPMAYEALVGAVQHPTRDVQIEAAFHVSQISQGKDKRATTGLISALQDSNPQTAYRAAKFLGWVQDDRSMPALFGALHREDGRLRRAAGNALVRFGSAAVPRLIEELEHTDARVREVAAWALGEIRDPAVATAVPKLIACLNTSRATLALAAEEALLKIGDVAVLPLMEAIAAPEWHVRLAVVKLLSEIGNPEAIPVLTGALEDENSTIRTAAAEALGVMGNASVIEALSRALGDVNSYEVRCAAALALGAIGDTEAVPALIEHLEANSNPTQGRLDESSYGSGLQGTEHWNQNHFCSVIAEALRSFGTPEATAAVERWQKGHGGKHEQ